MGYKPLNLGSIMPFGKFKGKRVIDIALANPHYFIVLIDKMESFKLSEPDEKYIRTMANIVDHNNIMRQAYGSMNKRQSWGLSDNDMQ